MCAVFSFDAAGEERWVAPSQTCQRRETRGAGQAAPGAGEGSGAAAADGAEDAAAGTLARQSTG